MPSIYFYGNPKRYKEHNNTILQKKILSYKTLFSDVVTTTGYAFLPAMNESLNATLVTICTSGGDLLLCHYC